MLLERLPDFVTKLRKLYKLINLYNFFAREYNKDYVWISNPYNSRGSFKLVLTSTRVVKRSFPFSNHSNPHRQAIVITFRWRVKSRFLSDQITQQTLVSILWIFIIPFLLGKATSRITCILIYSRGYTCSLPWITFYQNEVNLTSMVLDIRKKDIQPPRINLSKQHKMKCI
jgi:hypothetical protein